jgi:putative spermidine/putrescine transport system substrate-binding protein
MADPIDELDPFHRDLLTREELLRKSLLGVGALAVGPAVLASPRTASAAAMAEAAKTLTVFGPDYATLESWSGFRKATGMKMKWSIIADVTGVFVNKVITGRAAERNDLLFFDGGVQKILAPRKYIVAPDTSKLHGWNKIPKSVLYNPQMKYHGKPFGIPGVYNADSFGYYPKDLGRPNSFSVIFEDNRTRGKVAIEDNWLTTLPMAATYMIAKGYAKIKEPSNMTPDEAKKVVDFLIHRKKQKQFRTFWTSWEQAVSLLGTREVIAANVWEPVIRALLAQGKKVSYAYTKEGYNKWMGAFWIPKHSADNPAVYRALNYFLGGEYGANIAALRGYATGRPDLARAYVRSHPGAFKKRDRAYILQKYQETVTKYRSKHFWQNAAPDHRSEIEAEWERFKQA